MSDSVSPLPAPRAHLALWLLALVFVPALIAVSRDQQWIATHLLQLASMAAPAALGMAALLTLLLGRNPSQLRAALLPALGWLLLYVLCVSTPSNGLFRDGHWNWQGKLLNLLWLVPFILVTGRARAVGFVSRVEPGSLRAITAPVLLIVAVQCYFGLQHPRAWHWETVLFQAAMPGLEEEMLFRGLLLAHLLAFLPGGLRIGGARMGWAAILVSLPFAVGHMIQIHGGELEVYWMAGAFTFLASLFFTWVRLRTGNLWVVIVVHNLLNLSTFVPAMLAGASAGS